MNIPSHEMKILLRMGISAIRHGVLRMLTYMEQWLKGELKEEDIE